MATIIHTGDHTTDCETCRLQCDCQDCRIQRKANEIDWERFDWQTMDLDDVFEDRDPSEFI
jgi:hypothetical protein